VPQQGYPPRRGGLPGPGRDGRASRPDFGGFEAESEDDIPPWAGSSIYAMGPGQRAIRPPGPDERGRPDRRPEGGERGRRAWRRPVGPPSHRGPLPGQAVSGLTRERYPSGYQEDPRHAGPPGYGEPPGYNEPPRYSSPPGYGGPHGYGEQGYGEQGYGEPSGPARYASPGDPRDGRPRPPGGPGRRLGRAAAARARKSRRRLYLLAGLVVVVVLAVLAATGSLPFLSSSPKSRGSGLVTTFQPGELRTVPNACHAVSQATLRQYLSGPAARMAQSLDQPADSQCTWTLDARPVYRVLEVTSQAYAPFPLNGNGSATSNAIAAYGTALGGLRHPAKDTHLPRAQLGGAPGLGSRAFTAFQVVRAGGTTTFLVTVVVRYRNVLVTVVMQGLNHGKGYGPASTVTLRAGALAAAHDVVAGLRQAPAD
jgi:hypothetical protein